MPFFVPFKEKFERGDIIYGTGVARRRFVEQNQCIFPQSLSSWSFTPEGEVMVIDHYAGGMHNISPDGKGLLQDSTGKYQRPLPKDQNDFTRAILSHPKYKTIWYGSDAEMQRQSDNMLFWGRKCKAGLNWISNSIGTRTIHFLLDDIDIVGVVKKRTYSDCNLGLTNFNPITGRELRWIYRNRHDPQVIKCIQFWLNCRPVSPPWIGAGTALWREYIPRSSVEWEERCSRSPRP